MKILIIFFLILFFVYTPSFGWVHKRIGYQEVKVTCSLKGDIVYIVDSMGSLFVSKDYGKTFIKTKE
jgi:hypothetical protein